MEHYGKSSLCPLKILHYYLILRVLEDSPGFCQGVAFWESETLNPASGKTLYRNGP